MTMNSTPAGYQLGEQLYSGSRTLVYRATRLADRQAVVIKLPKRDHPSFSELVQFRNQFTLTQSLDHPGILKSYSLEDHGRGYALVMEDYGGVSLSQLQADQGPIALAEGLRIALQLADSLDYLYQQRVIHKDIKPANILINPATRHVKLIDFSIASWLNRETQDICHPSHLEGTLAYLSPEQTGRMNRGIDYRTDFYSLGVTLYHLLTGQLPFVSEDVMELVHCHLAQAPVPPHQIPDNPQSAAIPPMVSDIILKLMAKNAEDRYQSALGLKHDLTICLQEWETTGEVEPFLLGQRDLCDRFTIPEKLYGRATEVATLLKAFQRVAQISPEAEPDRESAPSELVLVAGFSGIGKTAVVNQVQKPIVRQRGYFIKGKYDQFQRNLPFSALVQALRDLMGQFLSESDRQLQAWRTQIQLAVGENGQVLIDVIPELEQIIGPQPAVPKLVGDAAQNRFNLLFQKFIQAVTTPEHPLVLFLDDLQWADAASLNLLKLLLNEADIAHLLVIGAYRDNEVSPGHPLMLTLAEIDPTIVHTLTLGPLMPQDINHLVADTLSCPADAASPLAQLVYQKTHGNPFFTTQLLKALHHDGFIVFNHQRGCWECDIAAVKTLTISEDVAEFMALQLQKLSPVTQSMLQLAACMGNQFDLATLAIVADQTQPQVAAALWWALKEELVIPRNDIYKFYQDHVESSRPGMFSLTKVPDTVHYRFLHDRVQQAAYGLISEADRPATHLKIGQRLLQSTPLAEQDQHLFTIVNQLNQGETLITEAAERLALAQLNLMAGRKAKNCTAYAAAMEYADRGIQALAADCWQTQYALTLDLHNLATEVAYLCGDFQRMEKFAQVVLTQATSLFDQIEVYNVKILAHTAENQPLKAVELALGILQQLGTVLPDSPTEGDIQQTLGEVAALHPPTGIASLLALPEMTDPNALAALQILNAIFTPCYAVAPMLIPLISANGAKLSITYGSAPLSAIAYAGYGMLLCGVADDVAAGYDFGQLALNLLPQFSQSGIQTRVMCMTAAFVLHWCQPLPETLKTLQAAFQSGTETGDLQYTAWSYYHDAQGSYLSGQELASLERKLTRYEQALAQIKQDFQRDRSQMLHQLVLNWLGQSDNPDRLVGTVYDEETAQAHYQATQNTEALFFLHFYRMLLSYGFDDLDAAWEELQGAETHLASVPAQAIVPVFYFYDALIRLARCASLEDAVQSSPLDRVQANLEKLRHWSSFAPSNQQHRVHLLEAEQARVLGQKSLAIEAYDLAIAAAKASGYLQEEGLAHELAARFYLAWEKYALAQTYLIDAYYCYSRWGAKAKVEQLERSYPQLLAPILNPTAPTLGETANQVTVIQTMHSTSSSNSAALDMMAVMKAYQALSSEMEHSHLLTTLLQVMLENAGADRGAILLPQANGLEVVIQGQSGATYDLAPVHLEQATALPQGLIWSVQRTQAAAIVNDVANNPTLAANAYFQTQTVKSLLCLPIVRQGQLAAILYLENRLTAEAFTPDRLKVLNLLCIQAAISLENARLYQQAQANSQQLQQSLHQLQQMQLQLVQREKMSALGNLVAGVAHEINNPVGFLAGNLTLARDYVADVLGLVDRYQQQFPDPGSEISEAIAEIELDYLQEDLPKLIESMQVGIDRITDISNSLRTFSRADTHCKVPFNLHQGIDSTILILKHRLKGSVDYPAIDVQKNYGEIPDVQCFPGQLNQVFMNLLSNAIDALEDRFAYDQDPATAEANPEKPTIAIQTCLTPDQQVEIQIQDNGPGMSPEVQAQVFDHLFTTKAVGKGTGLGLAIARQIVAEKHRGTIDLMSAPGQGTTFIIHLPIASVDV